MKYIYHQEDNRKKYCTAMDKAPPGKYLFLTANMIAVSVCKHSQGRYRTIFVHKGHCHLLMASKTNIRRVSEHVQRWHLILFLTDTPIKEYHLVGQHYLLMIKLTLGHERALATSSGRYLERSTSMDKLISKEILDLNMRQMSGNV